MAWPSGPRPMSMVAVTGKGLGRRALRRKGSGGVFQRFPRSLPQILSPCEKLLIEAAVVGEFLQGKHSLASRPVKQETNDSGRLTLPGDRSLRQGLLDLIGRRRFPCVGAKSALAKGGLRIETAACLTSSQDDARIHDRLARWSRAWRKDADGLRSIAFVFAGPRTLDETGFEVALWERINALTAIDTGRGYPRASGFSEDPRSPDFALSFGGQAYFAVGLHPRASRRARRSPSPTIVFNLHDQFSQLRMAGQYERMRAVILARDTAFDGRPNPMIARHGETSEARQYSGREVGEDWQCPFTSPGDRR